MARTDLMLYEVWGVTWKPLDTNLGAGVPEAGLKLHSHIKFDENHKGSYTPRNDTINPRVFWTC